MASDNKTSKFWRSCEVCGERMPSYALRDHMVERHPETMREREELGRHFDKRGMRVMGPGVLLFMILCSYLIFLTNLSGIVVMSVVVVGAAALGVVYFFYVQMRA